MKLMTDHSDPSGLYSYRRQPERVLFALDKLIAALSPVIGYEALHGTPKAGWSEGKTKEDIETWNDKTTEVMKDWPDAYWKVEREAERTGWLKVSLDFAFLRLHILTPSSDLD